MELVERYRGALLGLDEIDRSLARDLPVYVHCWGGKGRTGTVVGCYLARHGIATGKSALDKINELRRNVPNWNEPSPETRQQCEMVALWQIGE
jgi:protein-tyrosine phosphatase